MQNLKPEMIEKFAEFVEYLVGSCFNEQMNMLDRKEAAYLSKFLLERIHEVLDQYNEFRRLPLFQVLFFGDYTGKTMIQYRASPDPEIMNGWKLREAYRLLKAACDEWELKYTDPNFKDYESAGVEFSAIKKHISETLEGGEGEKTK